VDTSIDGEAGIDTLKFSTDVSFTGLSTLLTNIEKLDMTSAGNQTMSGLTLDKIFSMTDSVNTITIDGNAGDVVGAIDKTSWTKNSESVASGYTVYEYHKGSDVATLKIDVDILNNTGLA
jgi:hypothetical protein